MILHSLKNILLDIIFENTAVKFVDFIFNPCTSNMLLNFRYVTYKDGKDDYFFLNPIENLNL